MKVKFWGVRGSIPSPGADTVVFGGNTSCISADFGDDLIIFDAGTGLRLLGNAILARSQRPRLHLFLSHLHWDHIQGFPFFAPAYRAEYSLDVYGQGNADQTLGRILAGQMEGPNFPVSLNQLGAAIAFRDLRSGVEVDLGFARVRTMEGRHPNGVLAYRLEDLSTGRTLVYATDTEHFPDRVDERILNLAKGADLFIYDGMYTPEEYQAHQGWGHSTWEQGFQLAAGAGVKTYVVFHHDPSHGDAFLEGYEREVQAKCRAAAPGMNILFAREGREIDLS